MRTTLKAKWILLALNLVSLFGSQALSSTHPYIISHGINFSIGNKYVQEADVRLEGPVRSFSFKRTYNSQSSQTGTLGYGWSTSFGEFLVVETEKITLVQGDGRHVGFVSNGIGGFENQNGRTQVIVAVTDGYTLTQANDTVRRYDSLGRLTRIDRPDNTSQVFTYQNDLLASITDTFGKSLSFSYTNGKLTTLTTPLGDYIYTYDANDNLTSVIHPDGTSKQYRYEDANDVHNLTGIIDEEQTVVQSISYDNQDRVVSSVKADNQGSVDIEYLAGLQRTVTDSLGTVTTYQLEVQHGVAVVASFTGPGCSSCGSDSDSSYTFTDRLQIETATDANGTITSYTYDNNGNKLTKTEATGTALERTTTYSYTADNKVDTITLASVANPGQQVQTSMDYDSNGNLSTRIVSGYAGTDPVEQITSYSYNQFGQITSIDGPRTDVNDTTTLTYYPNDQGQGLNRGFLHTVTNALGHTVTYADYNALGQVETITNAIGVATTRTFNSKGQLSATTTGGLTTSYAYDDSGQLTSLTVPGDRVISYTYTPTGQIESVTDNQGNRISYSYDSEGKKIGEQVHDPASTLTRFVDFEYNAAGKLSKVLHPDGPVENYDYDLIGNLVTIINATGMQTDYTYDALNNLLSITEAGDSTAGYIYDANSNTTMVSDPEDRTTIFTYDDLGNRLTRTAPDTGLTSYNYDTAGNLLTVTDSKNQTMSYAYDALNRPVRQSYPGAASDIVNTYDQGANSTGKLSGVDDNEGTRTFTYDSLGRLSAETRTIEGVSYTTSYNYNATTGELAGITYPSGRILAYTRDSNGSITGVSLDGLALFTAGSYLPFGPLKEATLGEQVQLSRSYDQRYQVNRIQGGGLDYGYTRDAAGHVTKISNIQLPDPAGKLTDYTYSSGTNQLEQTLGSDSKSYSYDAVGNMISDGVYTFIYDALNRLVQVEQETTIIATYGYDSQNRRVRKVAGGSTIHYHYDSNSQLIAETLADGTPIRDYFYVNGEPVGVQEYQSLPGVYYFINDHLGTPQRLVDGAGSVVWQAGYLPFGEAQVQVETVVNNLRFPGQYFDAETGLHYNWNRFYDPNTGRYISADPIGLAGRINLYAYVGGNPTNYTDPEGLRYSPREHGGQYDPGGSIGGYLGGGYGAGFHFWLAGINVHQQVQCTTSGCYSITTACGRLGVGMYIGGGVEGGGSIGPISNHQDQDCKENPCSETWSVGPGGDIALGNQGGGVSVTGGPEGISGGGNIRSPVGSAGIGASVGVDVCYVKSCPL